MTLTIQTQEDEQRQLNMTIEVAEERVAGEMKRIVRGLSKQVNMPGFRKGKVPYKVIVKRFGEQAIRAEALEDLAQDVVFEAIEQEGINLYIRPSLDEIDLETATYTVTVPLEPVVTLGDYRSIRREVETPEITDEAVDAALEEIRQSHIMEEDVDRSAVEGDKIVLSGKGYILPREDADEDEEDPNANNTLFATNDTIDFVLDPAVTFAGTDFVEQLIGTNVGDHVEFTITYPDDYEVGDFAGRQAKFEVEVLNVKERIEPELNDELAVEEGEESLEALRERVQSELLQEAENEFRSELLDEWVKELRDEATMVYAPAAIEVELDESVENMKKQVESYGWEWDQYLTMQEETEENLRNQWREDAVDNYENSLALREFIETEMLSVSEKELTAKMDERLEQFKDLDAEMREMMRSVLMGQDGIQRMANELVIDKVYERVTDILAGEAKSLEEIKAEQEAAAQAAEEAAAAAEEAAEAAESNIAEAEDTAEEVEAAEADASTAESNTEEAEDTAEDTAEEVDAAETDADETAEETAQTSA